MAFITKPDFSNNRQAKQFQYTNTQLSGTTTFGVEDVNIPINFTGDTINIDALQNIRTRGIIIPNPLPTFSGTNYQLLGRDFTTGKIVEITGISGGTGSDGVVTGATLTNETLELQRSEGLSGVTVDLGNLIYPSVPNTYFVSQTGDDNTGEYENKDKPFLTLDAAITAFKSNSDATRIFILDNGTYSFDQDLDALNIEFASNKSCTISIENNSGVIRYLNSANGFRPLYNFNFPLGTLILEPVSIVRGAINSTDAIRFIANVNSIISNGRFGVYYARYYDITVNDMTTTRVGDEAFLCTQTDPIIISKFTCQSLISDNRFWLFKGQPISSVETTINYLEFNDLVYLTGNNGNNKLKLRRVNNTGTNPNLVLGGQIELEFTTENPFIGIPMRFYFFNTALIKFTISNSIIDFDNLDIIYGISSTAHTLSINNCVLKTTEQLVGYQHEGTVILNNSTIICNKLSNGWDDLSTPILSGTTNPMFIFRGNNNVIVPNDGDPFITESYPPSNSFIEIDDGVLNTNGVIDSSVTMNKGYDFLTNFSENYVTGMTVTGTSTKTITLTNRDGSTITADFTDNPNLQTEISTSFTVSNSHLNHTLFLDASGNSEIIINSGLTDNFATEFINVGTTNYRFLTSGTANLNTPDGTLLLPNRVAFLIKRGSTNEYWLKGELE